MPLINKTEYDELKAAKKELEELKADLNEINVDELPTEEDIKEKDDRIKELEDEIKDLKANKILNPSSKQLTAEQYKAKAAAITARFKK